VVIVTNERRFYEIFTIFLELIRHDQFKGNTTHTIFYNNNTNNTTNNINNNNNSNNNNNKNYNYNILNWLFSRNQNKIAQAHDPVWPVVKRLAAGVSASTHPTINVIQNK
jgi:hypothetical protein